MSAHLEDLLRRGDPLLDVRAPAEFAKGAVPNAANLPLLTDDERRRVGLCYKTAGGEAAVALGRELVSGGVRESRLAAWVRFVDDHPGAWVCCWRGGLRSEIVQRWLAEAGRSIPRVPGGFKALRRACLAALERAPGEKPWLVLGGRTGSGKTELINAAGGVDLEGLARHRGSAFGAYPGEQPAPVSFENALAVAFLQHTGSSLLLEDESRTIGRLAVPGAWYAHMQTVPLLVLEVSLAERVLNIRREYVDEPITRGEPPAALRARYREALERIRKRLGGARCRDVLAALDRGFEDGDHDTWIERLLVWYYDPMYDHQLGQKRQRIVARGDRAAILRALAEV